MKSLTLPAWRTFLFLCCSLLLSLPALAQKPSGKEANIWYFGLNAGLDFNHTPPRVLLDGKAFYRGGFATVSDANGQLLFYTRPDTVFDRRHQPMPNSPVYPFGFGHNPNSAIAMPWVGNPGKYFLFSAFPTFQYSVIDMSLNGGFGDVVPGSRQVELLDTTYKIAGLVAVHHQNRRDIWITGYENGTNKYYTYLISPTGVSATPIINQVGVVTNAGWNGIVFGYTAFKISPDGRTIAKTQINPSSLGPTHEMVASTQLLNFDPASAAMTDIGVLPDSTSLSLEFSPDGTLLYASGDPYRPVPNWTNYNYLWQYDLSLGTPSAMYANRILLASDTNPRINGGNYGRQYGFMQTGPDGKIYMAMGHSPLTSKNNFLSVIHKPNEKGAASRFVPYSIDINPDNLQPHGRTAGASFPNFVQSYFFRPKIYLRQMCLGDSAFFSINNRGAVDSVRWDFGDPTSGAANTSTAFSPAHYYQAGGTYPVKVIAWYQFGADTLTENIFVPTAITKPQLGPDRALCPGDTLVLNAFQPGNVNYLWQDSTTATPNFTVTRPGTYWVEVSNGCGTSRDSVTIRSTTAFTLNLGPDKLLCPGETLSLSVPKPDATYLWQDSSTASAFTVTKPGLYWVEVKNACTTLRDSLRVTYRPPVKPQVLGSDTTFCAPAVYRLSATSPGATGYTWSTGSRDSVINVTGSGSGLYWVDIRTACGLFRDSVTVNFASPPEVSLGADATICAGETRELRSDIPALHYRWQDNSTASNFRVTEPGLYWLEVTTACGTSRDSIQITLQDCMVKQNIPNIITPNLDNRNDRFEPQGLEPGPWSLEIYNRWGTRVYQHENYTSQWPETDIAGGTYYYLLRHKTTGKTHKGWVEVTR